VKTIPESQNPQKGALGGECNRTACSNPATRYRDVFPGVSSASCLIGSLCLLSCSGAPREARSCPNSGQKKGRLWFPAAGDREVIGCLSLRNSVRFEGVSVFARHIVIIHRAGIKSNSECISERRCARGDCRGSGQPRESRGQKKCRIRFPITGTEGFFVSLWACELLPGTFS